MPHAIGVDLDIGIDAGDAARPILAELGVRLGAMKDIVGQGGQADLEPGRREAAEKTVVVVHHGVMPHRGQFGRRPRSPEVHLDPRSRFVQQPPQGRQKDPPQRIVQPAGGIDQLHGSVGAAGERSSPVAVGRPPHLAKIDRAGNHFHVGIQQPARGPAAAASRPAPGSPWKGTRSAWPTAGAGQRPDRWPSPARARRSCRPGRRAPARPPPPPCAATRRDRAGRCGKRRRDRPHGHRAARPCLPG